MNIMNSLIKMITPLTLRQATEQFVCSMKGIRSEATIVWYKNMLKYLLIYFKGDEMVSEIAITDLRAWRSCLYDRPKKLSAWTIYGIVKCARSLFRWLYVERYLMENPTERLEMPKLPDPTRRGISNEDSDQLVACAKGTNIRNLALVLFVRDTGCRRGGAATVRLGDLNLEATDPRLRRRIWVVEKGEEGRTVFLQPRSFKALLMWLEVRPYYARPEVDTVFVGIGGRSRGYPLSPAAITQLYERLGERARLKGSHSPHQFRHRFCRELINAGANLAQVAQVAGHKSVETTNAFYGKLDTRQLQEAVDRYLPEDPPDFDFE